MDALSGPAEQAETQQYDLFSPREAEMFSIEEVGSLDGWEATTQTVPSTLTLVAQP